MVWEVLTFPWHYFAAKYRFANWSQKQIESYQYRKMRKIVRYAVKHSPFYRQHYAGRDLSDVWDLPPVNKQMMMDNLSEFNTLGLSRQDILGFCLEVEKNKDYGRRFRGLNIGMSSGTSGNKGVEITTPREENYLRALFFARFPFIKGEKINLAFILRVTVPAFDFKFGGHRLNYINQLQPLEQVVAQLQEIQPNVLSGPPSYLKLLAGAVEREQLNISPRRLVSYAEVLYADTREYLERVFACPVHEIYKATEGAIAMSCRHGSLHINEDLIAVETLDADGSPTAAGRPCQRMLVTDLKKKSQPIIRYELNDLVTISPNLCPCGSRFRVISAIQGRSDDMLTGRDREGNEQQIMSDYITRAVISASDDVEEFQVVQDTGGRLLVVLLLKPQADRETIAGVVAENIGKVFLGYDCLLPPLEFRFHRPEANVHSNKFARVRRERIE